MAAPGAAGSPSMAAPGAAEGAASPVGSAPASAPAAAAKRFADQLATSSCASHAVQALLSPLAIALDSRNASACWLLLREGVLRDHPGAAVALRDACTATKLQPCQQLLSWVRKAKDTGTTNCLRPKAALATATKREQWSPVRREAGCSGQALLACCRVVAVLDEIQDCIEEAPATLTAATTPRLRITY